MLNVNKSFSVFAFLVGILAYCGGAYAEADAPDSIDGTTLVSAEDVVDLVGTKDNLVIVDSRTSAHRAKGYIEGSVGLPDTETTPESLAKNIPSKDTPVCFYCNGVKCGRSVVAAKMAVAEGYSEIYWFRGGWDEWAEKGLPVAK